MKEEVVSRLKEFMEHEARSCSMDPGCITPEYVYRMWGKSFRLRKSIMNSMNYKVGIIESITQKKKLPPSRRIFRVSQEVGFESSRVQDGQVVE